MLEKVVTLEPYADRPEFLRTQEKSRLLNTDPEIMIPGINADGSLYPIEKIEAHQTGAHHLAISVFVFDGDDLLVQQRAPKKYHCGGQWANTCCTHPHWGEDPKSAASRRLREELGFSVPIVERLIVEYSTDVGNGLWEKERVHMFRADVPKGDIEKMCELNPLEVSDIQWMTARSLRQDIAQNPSSYTPWFRIYLKRFPDLNF